MKEFSTGPHEIILDGRVVDGRTRRRIDDTYESLDLVGMRLGSTLTLMTDQGAHEFTKTAGDENRSAMEGWTRADGERALGTVVRLVLLEPNPNGVSFLTPGVVVREGLEMGALKEGTNVIASAGTIISIAMREQSKVGICLPT